MSTQQTGDRPPGDNDYYDSVEEESIRAAGSGCNPNAAAWDPEKMELHRIVNRLLALEERRVLPARPVEHAVTHKVKLPAFCKKDAGMPPPGSGWPRQSWRTTMWSSSR